MDTSAIYALADRDDTNHAAAVQRFEEALSLQEEWVLHNYIIVESAALLHRRLGWQAARRFVMDADGFQVVWVDDRVHRQAIRRWTERHGRISLVDQVSFLVMREQGIRDFLGFDDDFVREGFRLWKG